MLLTAILWWQVVEYLRDIFHDMESKLLQAGVRIHTPHTAPNPLAAQMWAEEPTRFAADVKECVHLSVANCTDKHDGDPLHFSKAEEAQMDVLRSILSGEVTPGPDGELAWPPPGLVDVNTLSGASQPPQQQEDGLPNDPLAWALRRGMKPKVPQWLDHGGHLPSGGQ